MTRIIVPLSFFIIFLFLFSNIHAAQANWKPAKNGDKIIIDAEKNTLSLLVEKSEIDERRKKWKKPDLKFKNGVLYKYAKSVSNASHGCVTDN